jgi:hypothetical protein
MKNSFPVFSAIYFLVVPQYLKPLFFVLATVEIGSVI